MTSAPAEEIPLSVITAREPVIGHAWVNERWSVVGVVAGRIGGDQIERRLLRTGPEGEQYLWSGFVLKLRRGDADSYYYNIVGQRPNVYVYCQLDDEGEPRPQSITVDYIDAMSHAEFGNAAFAVPMPADVYRYVEEFVLAYYTPDESKMKRKREPPKVNEIWGDD